MPQHLFRALLWSLWTGSCLAQIGCKPIDNASGIENGCSGEPQQRWYWDKVWWLCLPAVSKCPADQRPDLFESSKACNARYDLIEWS